MSRFTLKRRTFLALLAADCAAKVLPLSASTHAEPSRQTRVIDQGWRFILGDRDEWRQPAFDDTSWRLLDVPHDWSIEGEYSKNNPGGTLTGYLPTGIGWYRKEIFLDKLWEKKQVSITFDGVFMNSTVWLNGHVLGTRPYGYISFTYDLTHYLLPGRNVISVRVDNSLQPAARWYTGSGIYAHVRLTATSKVHFIADGVFVRAIQLSNDSANIAVSAEIRNVDEAKELDCEIELSDRHGKPVAHVRIPVRVTRQSSGSFSQRLIVRSPQLWSPDFPNMYQARLRLFRGSRVVDEHIVSFGIRTARFDADRGLLLNGIPVKLHGVAEHYCAAAVGSAIPDAILERQLRLLKEMGANAIRTAHHPRPPIFYELCDRIGLMVVNEIFDGWHKKAEQDYGARFFKEWWRRDLEACIRRDRNHPSIVLWSIGNETGPADIFNMTKLIHMLDATRMTTGGQMLHGVDVAGFNGPGGVPGVLEKYHSEHPAQPILATEEPHTLQTRGFYRVRTWWRDKDGPRYDFPPYGTNQIFFDGNVWYNSSYDNAGVRMSARTSCKRTASLPWLAGEFRWTGRDYLGEAGFGDDHWPARMWNYGVIDLCGLPKDHFYLYQSFWTSSPMVHLLPHWTHPGMDGVMIPVVAYSNAPEVELFLNGKSLGRRKPEPLGDFVWHVPYQPGELKAIAYSRSQSVASARFQTAGSPSHIGLETDNCMLRHDRRDIAVLTFTIRDAHNIMVPWAMNRVEFRVSGPVKLLGYENGDPVDITPHRVPYRQAFYGVGRGFFESTPQKGNIDVTAFAILGEQLFTQSTTVAIASNRIALRGALPRTKMEIRYTLDGTPATTESPLYSAPFILRESVDISALLVVNGKPWLTTKASFRQGKPVPVIDPRWQDQTTNESALLGPLDKRLLGTWATGDRIVEFRPDGRLVDASGNFEGWWWYASPQDAFESPDDLGHGQIRFAGESTAATIKLIDKRSATLQFIGPTGTESWRRIH